ncbi:fumarylacetoacetate hydrolase family protein [Aurantimonas sp. C2-6-R+9]|uniref:fumarylacetoacetate hydrolase family protein n=1 Tax=unclassified Aurantimonas TaxID=2638230 RepID=UPI002E19905A|nr:MULTISPECIES: fumarylacetoacetate hydrolase family protein [unclassified Aurantimonas]MEC5290344.1 fumarylacetoacetate hydrolase family protein [Aurantimonas sp. C2-3-R2]MEC5379824.1 fumarylacetoacetate hydrolase family protein [Aurantimonas sp. C2-6-R+9]MEC5411400.1 fumarylacetoacetate hydrolase family protein [Aurantimonas sp. C2-4-R8]
MRLVRYGESGAEKPGLIDDENVLRDLSNEVDDIAGTTLSKAGLKAIRKLDPKSLPKADPSNRIGPPVGRVGNFIAVGLNYADHAKESGMDIPAEPILFNKAPSSIVGPHDDVIVPKGSDRLDWEVEIAIVIGEEALYVSEEQAMDHVAGFCLCNDVSERTFQTQRGGQWMKGKSAPSFGPLGPWLVTPDALGDPQAVDLWLDVNGERMQTGSTATMIFPITKLVSYISQFMRLMPGDVITTGTPPGVGMGMKPERYLKPGDIITVGGRGLGEQRQTVQAFAG